MPNDAGVAISTVDYAPFGGMVAVRGADVRKKFIDKELDGESATYNTGVRQYEPETGFTSIDPMWEKYPGWTPYHYCFHNPLGAKDPSGMDTTVGDAIVDGLGDALDGIVHVLTSPTRYLGEEKSDLSIEGLKGLWNTATGGNGTYAQVRLLVGLGTETAFWGAVTGGIGAAGGAGRGATQVGKAVEKVGKAAQKAEKTAEKVQEVTKKIKPRQKLGRDGAASSHITEKVNGKTNSVTHQVIKDGKVVHQHQKHVGKYGTERRFPDEWVEYPTIPKE